MFECYYFLGWYLMFGYSHFNYDQMTLVKVEVHSDDLELLHKAATEVLNMERGGDGNDVRSCLQG